MPTDQKITVQVSRKLLQKARAQTGKGITPTVRQGLELLAAGDAYEKLRALRGKIKFSISLDELRKDGE